MTLSVIGYLVMDDIWIWVFKSRHRNRFGVVVAVEGLADTLARLNSNSGGLVLEVVFGKSLEDFRGGYRKLTLLLGF